MFSCGGDIETVRFKQSQPNEGKEVTAFRKKDQGRYQNRDNSNQTVTVTKQQVFFETLYRRSVYKNDSILQIEMDSGNLSDSSLIAYFSQIASEVEIIKDSLILHTRYYDTIVPFQNTHVVKRHKGMYFVNSPEADSHWYLQVYRFEKGNFQIMEFEPNDSLLLYDYATQQMQIMDGSPDYRNTIYLLNPDKKELMELLESRQFVKEEVYLKK